MWRFVYTRCLEKADDIQTACRCGLSKDEAKMCFDKMVMEITARVLANEHLNFTMNIHNMKAVIQEEDVRHIVAAMENSKENAI